MGLFKKGLSLYGSTWGVPVRPSTKKERNAKEQRQLLQQQNALLQQIAEAQTAQAATTPTRASGRATPPAGKCWEYTVRVRTAATDAVAAGRALRKFGAPIGAVERKGRVVLRMTYEEFDELRTQLTAAGAKISVESAREIG